MSFLGELLSTLFDRTPLSFGLSSKADQPIDAMMEALVKTNGETAGLALSRSILTQYDGLDDNAKIALFEHLAEKMNINPEDVETSLKNYNQNPNKKTYQAFMKAAEPRRQELFRRLNHAPGATAFLVRMRADLLRLGHGKPQLEALDLDLKHLFVSWFNRGFLVLRRVSWQSPAHILEKIIAYEAVHAIDSWDDLRRRMEPEDRRCFAFFHPSMPDEPLIFVEVALTHGIANSIQVILAENRDMIAGDTADTAVFYSISNCQAGLAGISFGNSLIKQVAADLAQEWPGLKTFVTLSPIPKLAAWSKDMGIDLAAQNPDQLKSMAAHYLLNAKSQGQWPYDPVARFHLGNGAMIHALHGDADLSEKGIAQSGGMMVNYLYDLKSVESNQDKFAEEQVIKYASDISTWAEKFAPSI